MFVAIGLPDEVKATLREVQQELKTVVPTASTAWTRPEAMHLTLRFLGDVEASRVADLERSLGASLAGFGAIDVVCERLGAFPDLRFPRVVWAGASDAEAQLTRLHEVIDVAVDDFTPTSAEAKFVGHVTIARPKRIRRPDAERIARFVEAAAERRFGAWRAGEVELIRSEPSPTGSRYTTLARFRM
jgi:2'-5' RNA ligase